jgi:prepilin-type N-terminal cleavage/methylation domain-containing protein
MGKAMMATATIGRMGKSRAPKPAEGGFSLLEVMISMVILTVGLVSLLGVFGLAMASTQTSQQDMIAKQLADEAYESIVTARDTSQIGWDQINNVGTSSPICINSSPCGIFVGSSTTPTFEPILLPGPDGIFGTADDTTEEILREPGPDGIYGDANDILVPLTSYQRAIQIQPVYNASGEMETMLRSVTITMQYTVSPSSLPKTYVLNSYISAYN